MHGPGQDEMPGTAGRAASDLERWLPWLVLLPIAASIASAFVQHWVVVSDGAAIMVRARDVWGGHVPTLGMPTSIPDLDGGPPSYHPGPLLFWILAPFALVFGPTVGAIMGVSTIQGAAISGCVIVMRRSGDRTATIGAAIAALLVASTVFGPGHFFDPFNTALPAVPLLLTYLLAWRLACGDRRVLAASIAVGSFCVQAHVTYAVPVAVVLAPAVLVCVGPDRWRPVGTVRPGRRNLAVSVVVLLGCWSGPIVDAVLHQGGNARLLLSGAGGTSGVLGLRGAAGVLAIAGRLPPVQFAVVDDASFRSGPGLLGVVVLGLVGWIAVRTWRRTDRAGRRLLAVAGAALAGTMVDAALLPDAPIESPQLTWLKVVVPFVVLALVTAGRATRAPQPPRLPRLGPGVLAVVVAASCLPFPVRNPFDADRWLFDAEPRVRSELVRQLPATARYRVRARGGVRFELLQHALIADLDGRGWDVGVTSRNRTYYGDHRVLAPGPSTTDLFVQAADLGPPVPGARRVASFRPDVDPSAVRWVQDDLRDWAAAHPPVELTGEGRMHLAEGLVGLDGLRMADVAVLRRHPERLVEQADVLAAVYRNGWIARPELTAALSADVVRVLGPSAVSVWAAPSTAGR